MSVKRLNLMDAATAEELWRMQHAAYRQEAGLIGVPHLPPLQDTVQTLQNCGETFYGFFAEDGELAGAVSIREEQRGIIVICRMMVDPDCHRRGIGTRLLQHVFSEAPAAAAFTVTAEIRNEPAIRLYERNGFHRADSFEPASGITMMRFVKERA